MKKIFITILVIGFLGSSNLWGVDKKNEINPIEQSQKNTTFVTDTYNKMVSLAQKITKKIISKAYNSISSIFNNVISILLGLIAFFWLFKNLKTGTISKEEMYKAMVWIIVFVFVYVLLNSPKAYYEFINLFYIPQHLVSSALSIDGGNTAQQLNNAFVNPYLLAYKIAPQTIDYYWNSASLWEKVGAITLGIFAGGVMTLIYSLFLLINFILVIAVIIIHIYSIFLSGIYMAFLPIMIPLLLIPQTKSIFFAWVKSFIGITMYVPLSMISVSVVASATDLITAQDEDALIYNIPFYTLCGIVTCIIGIILLQKIPTWISELLGVANQGVGMGGAMGMLKTAGMGLAGYAKGAISNITSAKSGKTAVARGIGNVLTGGMGGALSQAKTGAKSFIKNGFKARGEYTGKK